MAIELEAKVRVAELTPLRRRLTDLRAIRKGLRRELNIYFDTPDRRLLAADQGLRVRSLWPVDDPTAGVSHVITFKGPQAAGSDLKAREEIEFNVDDDESAVQLLARLGYQPQLGFEKRRETWLLNNCAIELDELPLLGTFAEIEGDSRDAVMQVLQRLGLRQDELITESYISMMKTEMSRMGVVDPIARL